MERLGPCGPKRCSDGRSERSRCPSPALGRLPDRFSERDERRAQLVGAAFLLPALDTVDGRLLRTDGRGDLGLRPIGGDKNLDRTLWGHRL